MQSWATGPVLGFDTETTGVDVRHDRIVTAALVLRDARGRRQRTWLIDPGVEIPLAASDIHGVTTDQARAEGARPLTALDELAAELAWAIGSGIPVVAYNANFDVTLLEHELVRWGLPTLADRLGREPGPVLDPLVLDRALDRDRPGKRRLVDLCRHYRVETTDRLHTAEVDVLATLQVLDCLVGAFPDLGERSLADLHEWQRDCQREWMERARTERSTSTPRTHKPGRRLVRRSPAARRTVQGGEVSPMNSSRQQCQCVGWLARLTEVLVSKD